MFDNKYAGIGGGIGFILAQIIYTPTQPGLALAERIGAGAALALLGAGIGALVWWVRLKKLPVLSRGRTLELSVLFLLVGIAAGWAWLDGHGDYDECILENMGGATVTEAVWAIEKSCRAKFPEACYAWQKARDAKLRDKKTGIFDDLDKEYGANQPSAGKMPWEKNYVGFLDRELPLSYERAPNGCYEVLR